MSIAAIDTSIIIAFFVLTLAIGVYASRTAGKSSADFFLSGRNMPWWLLGVSMVATTFSADTPNLVADIVRKNGVAGNWVWWAFLLTGMLTVFVYARLWRRSGIVTDLEFYELRYSGKPASFLRGFRAIYLGVFFNIMIMATVLLAGIKISGILLGLGAMQTILLVSVVTVFYASIGGLKGVILTDFFQFIVSMIGMILAAIYIVKLPEVGGLESLVSNPALTEKIRFFPDFGDTSVLIPLFVIPIAVQWWSVWYPGAEPGGGGYIAQRMLSSKNEKNAIKATLFFNLAHYALRPWPWIIIALASIVVFPELTDIQAQFPNLGENIKIDDDLAFPAMLAYLPSGLMGLVIASLIAALMSTISTHLNWGSSYVVNDFYKRFMKPEASEKELVAVGRISTVVLMVLSAIFALYLTGALQAFNILLQIGAGTGLIFILRWFWWRINAYSEITAMTVSFIIAAIFEFSALGDSMSVHGKMMTNIFITTIAWVTATFLSKPTDDATLISFYKLIKPHKEGWRPILKKGLEGGQIQSDEIATGRLSTEILMMLTGCVAIYALLFLTGNILYGHWVNAGICIVVSGICGFILRRLWLKTY